MIAGIATNERESSGFCCTNERLPVLYDDADDPGMRSALNHVSNGANTNPTKQLLNLIEDQNNEHMLRMENKFELMHQTVLSVVVEMREIYRAGMNESRDLVRAGAQATRPETHSNAMPLKMRQRTDDPSKDVASSSWQVPQWGAHPGISVSPEKKVDCDIPVEKDGITNDVPFTRLALSRLPIASTIGKEQFHTPDRGHEHSDMKDSTRTSTEVMLYEPLSPLSSSGENYLGRAVPQELRSGEQYANATGGKLSARMTLTGVAEDQQRKQKNRASFYARQMTTDMLNIFDDSDHVDTGKSSSAWERWKERLKGTGFDLVIGMFILVNAVVMGIELEYGGSVTATAMDIEMDTEEWPAAKSAFLVFEHLFAIIFIIELILRVVANGFAYFKQVANLLDCGIVLVSILDLYVMPSFGVSMPNVTFLRLLRIIKLIKALRIIRQLRPFRHLRVLTDAMWGARGALMWSVVLLMFIHFTTAILFTQSLAPYLRNENNDFETRQTVYHYFGSLSRSLLTLFEMTLAPGAWAKIGRILIYKVHRGFTILFILYVYVVTFGAMKVITALFLKETLAAANNDQDMVIEEKVNSSNQYLNSLRSLFLKMDKNSNGSISFEELEEFLMDPRSCQWFQILDIPAPELLGIIQMGDTNNDNEISFEEFCVSVYKLKGGAKSIDLVEFRQYHEVAMNEVLTDLRGLSMGMEALWKEALRHRSETSP